MSKKSQATALTRVGIQCCPNFIRISRHDTLKIKPLTTPVLFHQSLILFYFSVDDLVVFHRYIIFRKHPMSTHLSGEPIQL